jgi:hypothetical protein
MNAISREKKLPRDVIRKTDAGSVPLPGTDEDDIRHGVSPPWRGGRHRGSGVRPLP